MVKCADGTGKVKAPSVATRRASTATVMPAKRVVRLSENEIEYNRLQREREKLPAQKKKVLAEELYKLSRSGAEFYGQTDKKKAKKMLIQGFSDREKETDMTISNMQKELGGRFRKRGETLDKAVSGKMKMGSKKVC